VAPRFGVMASDESLLPLDEVTDRLRILGQHYVGVMAIPVASIIGSVDRSVDFDRLFRPRRQPLRDRLRALRRVFPDGVMPPIVAYEVGGMYFVVDGHHRVALAQQLEMEYVDAEVTAIRISHALAPDVDVRQLIHTEQHRIFKERSRLLVGHPEAKIEFSRPTGYGQLLDLVEAHAYKMSLREEKLVPLEDATADWYEAEYLPAIAAVQEAELPEAYRHKTKGDIFLWVQGKRRELRTTNRNATWADAARAARREGVSRREQRALQRERRQPLPGRDQPVDTSRTVPPRI
jgi:ParB-like nuclease domain